LQQHFQPASVELEVEVKFAEVREADIVELLAVRVIEVLPGIRIVLPSLSTLVLNGCAPAVRVVPGATGYSVLPSEIVGVKDWPAIVRQYRRASGAKRLDYAIDDSNAVGCKADG
jgi:hypothetical protein